MKININIRYDNLKWVNVVVFANGIFIYIAITLKALKTPQLHKSKV